MKVDGLKNHNRARVLLEQHLYLKDSKTSYFIMNSYFYKSLMTKGFRNILFSAFAIMETVRFYDSNRHLELMYIKFRLYFLARTFFDQSSILSSGEADAVANFEFPLHHILRSNCYSISSEF